VYIEQGLIVFLFSYSYTKRSNKPWSFDRFITIQTTALHCTSYVFTTDCMARPARHATPVGFQYCVSAATFNYAHSSV